MEKKSLFVTAGAVAAAVAGALLLKFFIIPTFFTYEPVDDIGLPNGKDVIEAAYVDLRESKNPQPCLNAVERVESVLLTASRLNRATDKYPTMLREIHTDVTADNYGVGNAKIDYINQSDAAWVDRTGQMRKLLFKAVPVANKCIDNSKGKGKNTVAYKAVDPCVSAVDTGGFLYEALVQQSNAYVESGDLTNPIIEAAEKNDETKWVQLQADLAKYEKTAANGAKKAVKLEKQWVKHSSACKSVFK